MPTYQYACTACDHFFEVFQSFSDDSLTECPECQGRLRKVFNAVGVVFKGSGFYRTDSRGSSDGGSPSSSSSSGSSGDAGSKGSSSTSGSASTSTSSTTPSTSGTSASTGGVSTGS